ncbi:unnamed protein product [Ceratitis capitata]|uniref:(Mediterranean fruit fly) hypothetical protein n=1 Tax=Ceratitis capitata TaxID=7213 RepID=A0A811VHU4_CERCA|nr:unnamed protein product [Ceratitis capitata]
MFSFGTSAASTTNTSTTSIFTNTSKPNIEPTKTSSFSFGIKATESKIMRLKKKLLLLLRVLASVLRQIILFSPPTTTSFTFGKSAGANGDSAEKKSASTSFTPGSTIQLR